MEPTKASFIFRLPYFLLALIVSLADESQAILTVMVVEYCASLRFLSIRIDCFAPHRFLPPSLYRFGVISALTDLLSQSTPPLALPQLERLTLDIYATPAQLVAGCTPAWRNLAHALRQRRVALHIRLHSYIAKDKVSNDAAEQLRDLIQAFEEHGVKATVFYLQQSSR